jgi:hypothetical protein
MALLSYNLIEEILDVAETYAAQEKKRLGQLETPKAASPSAPRRAHAPQAKTAKPPKA